MNFAYNGRVEIDQTNVQCLLVAASFLHLQAVKDACCEFLKDRSDSLLVQNIYLYSKILKFNSSK